MSAFRQMKTVMNDQQCLTEALKKRFKEVESHPTAQPLYGIGGDFRTANGYGHTTDATLAMKANVIVRKKHVGPAANDMGFRRGSGGNFEAVISDYDSSKYNQKWLDGLAKDYMEIKAMKIMTAEEAELEERISLPNGSIQLRFKVMA